MRTRHEDGFSLIELMVAMVVTLMVTGAVYGLLTGGQNAFRREPGLSDRQQNIRSAMDLIMHDIGSAGAGMPDFIQTFTPGLDGNTGTLAPCKDNSGNTVTCPTGSSGATTDELEIMSNPDDLAAELACGYQGNSPSQTTMRGGKTQVQSGQVVMILLQDGNWTIRNINDAVGSNRNGSDRCTAGQDHAQLSFNPGNADPTGFNLPGGLCAGNKVLDAGGNCIGCSNAAGTACCSSDCTILSVLAGDIVRYRIRAGSDGVPNLERFSSGLSANFNANGVRQFQVIARGIEDLQVRYTDAVGTQTDNAPVVDQRRLNYDSLIRRVTVTLSARSDVQNVAGMQTAAAGQPNAMRGSLTSEASPRAVLTVLGRPGTQRATGWHGQTWN